MHIPSAPKWDPAVDGLDMRDFSRRALEYERSLLPRGIVLPHEGQVWRVIRDCEVTFLALFSPGALGPEVLHVGVDHERGGARGRVDPSQRELHLESELGYPRAESDDQVGAET